MADLRRKWRSYFNQLMALRAERGPYRFLVRKWDEVSDIDLATRVLETEFFEKEIIPAPLPIEKFKSILMISPHQDDETIGAGGTLLLAAAAGAKIDVLYTTDGATNNQPHTETREEYVSVRNEEARKVCDRLGADVHHLNISNTGPQPTTDDLDQLARIVNDVNPDLILAPWILDSPAKHRLTNHLLWLAHQRNKLRNFEVWGFQVHNTLFPNGYVDITSVADEKRELLEYFRSQNDHGVPFDHLAMGLAAWNSRFLDGSKERAYVEVFFALPLYELLRLVERFYFTDFVATYRGHSQVLPGALAIHETVMKSLGKSNGNGRSSQTRNGK
ncbi:MAG: PIG-L deacetylase family protein [Pyrinomonadaceae bacterium]